MMDSTPKRNAPVQVALTGDDLAQVDEHIQSVIFDVSRSEVGLVAFRLMLDTLRCGSWSLEELFRNYRKRPLAPLSAIELARIAADAALRQHCIERSGLGAAEFDRRAMRLACEEFEAYGYQWPEGEEQAERLRA